MWSQIFELGVPAWDKVVRALLVYLFLVVALRLAGKRELAQLNTLDFVVLLAVANAVQNGLIGPDDSVTGAVIGAGTLFVANGVLVWLLFRVRRLRRAVEGTPTVLVVDGAVDQRALRRERMTLDDLRDAVQESGVATFGDVRRATLEPNGRIVVVPRHHDESAAQYDALRDRLDELTALVRTLTTQRGT